MSNKNSWFIWSIILSSLLFISCGCEKEDKKDDGGSSYVTLSLDFSKQNQKMQSFGASDAWSTQFIGENWPNDKKEQIADYLFSNDVDESGNPIGIGLSGWRFNIGAGSTEQGAGSEIGDEWRRAQCFLTDKTNYDWTKHQGQRWFLQAAKTRGTEHFTAFVNSPPVHYTNNGKAWSNGGSSANLKDEHYGDYAKFLANVIDEIKNTDGIEFNYISPVNEPQWDWDNKGQEGTPFKNSEVAKVAKLLSAELIEKNLNTKIEIPDAAHIKYLHSFDDKPERGNQIAEFFDASKTNYVGDLPNIAHKVAGHSYYSTYPVDYMISERQSVYQAVNSLNSNLEFWQTEYCVLEGNNEINGGGRDLGMLPALYTARLIHYDLTVAHSSTWYWWLAVSPYDYKDGLVYIDHDKNDGEVYDSKLMWALGNYSRFIEVGMYRYNIIRSDNKLNEMVSDGLMVSGYASTDGKSAVYVMVNYANHDYPVKVKVKDKPGNADASAINVYTTSSIANNNLKRTAINSIDDIIVVPSESIVTVVVDY